MIFYLTLNDPPNGLYKSQVIDVVHFLNSEFNAKIKLVAFLSLRNFLENRKLLKKYDPNAIIIPAIPKLEFFRFNLVSFFLICLWYRPFVIFTRNIFANWLALVAKNFGLTAKVVYDGRGILKAEAEEYQVYTQNISEQIPDLEKKALFHSDLVMAVTSQMIDYWKKEYEYNKTNYFVIPCTVGNFFFRDEITDTRILTIRKELGFEQDDIVLVYSGSIAGWQSVDDMLQFLKLQLKSEKIKILLLCLDNVAIDRFENENMPRVMRKWLNSDDIPKYLQACDYGLILREKSITNSVSISTKFPEYLACGLKIIATDSMAISDFIVDNRAGFIIKTQHVVLELNKPAWEEKKRMMELARQNFLKSSPKNLATYKDVLNLLKYKSGSRQAGNHSN